jgi:hypothetical protein
MAGKLFLDHEVKEAGKLRRIAEVGAGDNAIQRGADIRLVRLFDDFVLQFFHVSERRNDRWIAARPLSRFPRNRYHELCL